MKKPATKDELIALFQSVGSYSTLAQSAESLGISPKTLSKWAHDHPELVRAAASAMTDFVAARQRELLKGASYLWYGQLQHALTVIDDFRGRWLVQTATLFADREDFRR